MDNMVRDLYAKMVLGGASGDAITRKRAAEVDNELKNAGLGSGPQEYEKFRDYALSVAVMSEEWGFILGMRYAMRLFQECTANVPNDWLC